MNFFSSFIYVDMEGTQWTYGFKYGTGINFSVLTFSNSNVKYEFSDIRSLPTRNGQPTATLQNPYTLTNCYYEDFGGGYGLYWYGVLNARGNFVRNPPAQLLSYKPDPTAPPGPPNMETWCEWLNVWSSDWSTLEAQYLIMCWDVPSLT